MAGTPAYEAGVLAGDLILKIDGKSTENMRLSEAVDMIQGDPGPEDHADRAARGTARNRSTSTSTATEIQMQSVLGDQRKPDNPKEWDFLIDKDNKIGYIRV